MQWLSLLLLVGCGYRAITPEDHRTVTVPYVYGDEKGQLTAALISELNRHGLYRYVRSNGELELRVSIVSNQEDVIGYRYDRSQKRGKIEKNLMPTENRRLVTAEVSLYPEGEAEASIGPFVVSASIDFDYIDVNTLRELAVIGPDGKPEKIIDFSQGQLDSIEGAQEGASHPLYHLLAKKIVAALQTD